MTDTACGLQNLNITMGPLQTLLLTPGLENSEQMYEPIPHPRKQDCRKSSMQACTKKSKPSSLITLGESKAANVSAGVPVKAFLILVIRNS